jgi:hypothetical protein
LSFIFKCVFIFQGFSFGISHMCILYFNQINPLYYFFSITLLPQYSITFTTFIILSSYRYTMYFKIIHSHILPRIYVFVCTWYVHD